MFLTHTRPDVAYSFSLVSRYMPNPSEEHMKIANRILRYVKRTVDFGMHYSSKKFEIVGFSDSDWGGSLGDQNSTCDNFFSMDFGLIT